MSDPTRSTFGEKSPRAPQELGVFSFLIGEWDGKGKTTLPDGKVAEFPVTWIGRYVLDGTAVADEMHSVTPDGGPYLGICLRQYGTNRNTSVIEYLNVTGSFLRKQVGSGTGRRHRQWPERDGVVGIARCHDPRTLPGSRWRQLRVSPGCVE